MIRPTFLSFETAKKALAIGQLGLDTVGHNIANANTAGYTRQRVDQVSISSNGYAAKYQTFGVQFPGQGADINGIRQIRDPYLDNRYRAEAATNGEFGVKHDGLTAINNIFDEIKVDGLHAKMGDLINVIDLFALQADSKEYGTVVRNTANQLVQILNKNAKELENARVQQVSDLKVSAAEDVNSILERIASLNVRIKEDNFYGNPSNELNDERNVLIDKLSEYMDIKVVRTPVKIDDSLSIERVSIEINGSGDPSKGIPNIQLVDSGSYNKIGVKEDPATGNVSIHLLDGVSDGEIDLDGDYTNGVSGDITNKLYKGAIKGFVDIINGGGPGASSGSTFRGIPYYQASLDEFAQKLAEVLNTVNNVSAQEAANSNKGVSGVDPMVPETHEKNLFAPLSLTLKPSGSSTSVPAWMDSIAPGSLEFSGKNYNLDFTFNSGANTLETTIDGITYTADYEAGKKIEFKDSNGKVAFSVSTTGEAPASGAVVVDASINAKNISISESWLSDPLYMTATKFNPVTKVDSKLVLTGTVPTWLKSVETPEGGTVKDGDYLFTKNAGGRLEVTINNVTYEAVADLTKGARIEFKDAGGNVGLIITASDDPTFDSTNPTKNIAHIKNSTGAANDNILKFKEALTASNSYSVSAFSGNFQEFLSDFQKEMGLDKELNSTLLDASFTVISGFADQRDSISAVSVDEEGITMMQYQNFYNAAARYMTTLDEALDKVINGMGTVGR